MRETRLLASCSDTVDHHYAGRCGARQRATNRWTSATCLRGDNQSGKCNQSADFPARRSKYRTEDWDPSGRCDESVLKGRRSQSGTVGAGVNGQDEVECNFNNWREKPSHDDEKPSHEDVHDKNDELLNFFPDAVTYPGARRKKNPMFYLNDDEPEVSFNNPKLKRSSKSLDSVEFSNFLSNSKPPKRNSNVPISNQSNINNPDEKTPSHQNSLYFQEYQSSCASESVRKSSNEQKPHLAKSFKDYLRRQRSTDGSDEVDLPLKRQLSVQSEREVLGYIEKIRTYMRVSAGVHREDQDLHTGECWGT